MAKKHDIIWLESVDSTNEEAKRHISDCDNLSVLAAKSQTAGKGQRGNTWSSEYGKNLLFSIVLKFDDGAASIEERKPRLSSRELFVLNEIVSLSMVDFLHSHGIQAQIKWPNDIYVGDRKICGILIENSLQSERLSSSIIGIGLNINQRNFDVKLPNPTSMLLCLPVRDCRSEPDEKAFDPAHSLVEFMDIFTSYHDKYLSAGSDLSPLRQLYLAKLWRHGRVSGFVDNTGREFTGIIRGLSEIGTLLVEDLSTGQLREFGFKEIGYIL